MFNYFTCFVSVFDKYFDTVVEDPQDSAALTQSYPCILAGNICKTQFNVIASSPSFFDMTMFSESIICISVLPHDQTIVTSKISLSYYN